MLSRSLTILTFSAILAGSAMGSIIGETESNDTFGNAQNINGSLPIGVILGSGGASHDFYTFTVSSPGLWSFGTFSSFDPELYLFDANGNVLEGSDDGIGNGGSLNSLDAYFTYFFTTPGTYYLGLCEFNCTAITGGLEGGINFHGAEGEPDYELHVQAIPEPMTFVLTGCGLLGLGVFRRRRQGKA